ncbi:nuclear GTPase SLIP-GC isoform X2 [Peromyscus maniculatus bairdii]|uniref:nuclear GTPase SLIP-GC isoform X2 n=1 Tax=Peromyscus maniculatus bairdii TaxID=230844 RepID=UPI003FCFA990
MAEAEASERVMPHSVDCDLFKEPVKKRRSRSHREQQFQAFPSAEQSALKEYEKLESRTRRILSNTYQKMIQSVFLDDSIPSGLKYLINRLLALIEKPPVEPIYVGFLGSTGAGKSSLINALIQQAMFLPVSGESICTSCIVQVSSGCCEQYEAKIHLLSDQEWKAELKDLTMLLHRADGPRGEEVDMWARDDAAEEAAQKLQMLYGHGAERRHYEDLLKMKPRGRIPTSRIITLKAEETIDKCSVIWVISDVERVSGGKAHEDLLNESIKACQRGFCRDIALVVTKTDKLHLREYLRERKMGNQAIQSQREAVLQRNEIIKLQRSRILKEKLKRKLPADSKVLEASDLVYTVSAHEYWQQAFLTEEESEIPKLREYVRKRLLDKKRRLVTKYVTEAFGLLLLTDTFNSEESLLTEHLNMGGLRRFVEEKMELLEKAIEQCFARMEQPLQAGVQVARASYRRILRTCLVRSRGNQGFHQTLKAVCLKNGVYASRTLARIDLNGALSQPIYDQIDPVFGGIFRDGKPTGSALMLHIDAFKHSLEERMAEIGIRNGWKYDGYKRGFLIQEISAILGGLEGHILRRKRKIYESVSSSIQSDLKPCYEEAAQITGKKACERMKDVIRRGVERQVAEGMFERARERMWHQFQQLKHGITEKVKGSITTMLTLAAPQGDGLYKELADVRSEQKEMEKLHRSLREVAENAQLRRSMQDFLLQMSPSKAGPHGTKL